MRIPTSTADDPRCPRCGAVYPPEQLLYRHGWQPGWATLCLDCGHTSYVADAVLERWEASQRPQADGAAAQ